MAVLLPPMSATSRLQHHMTGTHGQSVSPDRPPSPPDVVSPSANKRPKLSLQTTALSTTYGSLTRGIAPNATQTAYTPTTVNTLANTWDLSIRPSPISRTESPRPAQLTRIQTGLQPYTISLPFGVRPILKNSPLPPRALSVSASPRDARRKAFFPQPKRVTFRNNLEELIETKQYTTKHSDLTSSSEEEISDDEQKGEHSTSDTSSSTMTGSNHSPPPCRKRKVRRDSGICIDSKIAPSSTTSASEHNADVRSLAKCKRRKSRLTSDSPESVQNEGAALRSKSGTTTCSEDEGSPQPSSTVPKEAEALTVHQPNTSDLCSSPVGEERVAKNSTPDVKLEALKDSQATVSSAHPGTETATSNTSTASTPSLPLPPPDEKS